MKRNIRTKIKTITLYQSEYRFEALDKMFADAKALIPVNESGLLRVQVIENSDADNPTTYLDIFSVRIETDEEEAARIERDRRFKESRKKDEEEKEKRLYERLKAKYEKINN